MSTWPVKPWRRALYFTRSLASGEDGPFEGALRALGLVLEIGDDGRHFEDRLADVLSVVLCVFRVWIVHFRAPTIR
jgi:hypothetical protein